MTRPDGEGARVSRNHSLWDALSLALGVGNVTVLSIDEDMRAAEREQWG